MDDRNSSREMIGTLVFLITGPILWATALAAIYGPQSALCAAGAAEALVSGWVLVALVLLVVVDGLAMLWPQRLLRLLTGATPPEEQWPFLCATMRILAALSGLAMLYFGLAAVLLPACGGLR